MASYSNLLNETFTKKAGGRERERERGVEGEREGGGEGVWGS